MLVDVLYRETATGPNDWPGRIVRWRAAGGHWGPAVGEGRALLAGIEVDAAQLEHLENRRLMVVSGELVQVTRRRVGARTLIRARRSPWRPVPVEGG